MLGSSAQLQPIKEFNDVGRLPVAVAVISAWHGARLEVSKKWCVSKKGCPPLKVRLSLNLSVLESRRMPSRRSSSARLRKPSRRPHAFREDRLNADTTRACSGFHVMLLKDFSCFATGRVM